MLQFQQASTCTVSKGITDIAADGQKPAGGCSDTNAGDAAEEFPDLVVDIDGDPFNCKSGAAIEAEKMVAEAVAANRAGGKGNGKDHGKGDRFQPYQTMQV